MPALSAWAKEDVSFESVRESGDVKVTLGGVEASLSGVQGPVHIHDSACHKVNGRESHATAGALGEAAEQFFSTFATARLKSMSPSMYVDFLNSVAVLAAARKNVSLPYYQMARVLRVRAQQVVLAASLRAETEEWVKIGGDPRVAELGALADAALDRTAAARVSLNSAALHRGSTRRGWPLVIFRRVLAIACDKEALLHESALAQARAQQLLPVLPWTPSLERRVASAFGVEVRACTSQAECIAFSAAAFAGARQAGLQLAAALDAGRPKGDKRPWTEIVKAELLAALDELRTLAFGREMLRAEFAARKSA